MPRGLFKQSHFPYFCMYLSVKSWTDQAHKLQVFFSHYLLIKAGVVCWLILRLLQPGDHSSPEARTQLFL